MRKSKLKEMSTKEIQKLIDWASKEIIEYSKFINELKAELRKRK